MIDPIEKQVKEFAESMYNFGYQAARDIGRQEAWECANKIAHREDEMRNCFNDIPPAEVFARYSASEAMDRIKQYEQKQISKIKVGDEVEYCKLKYIVIRILKDGTFEAIGACGVDSGLDLSKFRRTGKHYPLIQEILNEMTDVMNDESTTR